VCRAIAMLVILGGCGSGLSELAESSAQRDLACTLPGRRLQAIGRLTVAPAVPFEVELYEASGCEQEQLYLCTTEPSPRCARSIEALPRPDTHAALARSLRLLRTASRARCPTAELSVVQESESLFVFEACDGTWLFHCLSERCERL
jgi:hypothetical protein